MQTIPSLLQGQTWPVTFMTLHTAITATGMERTLEGQTPFTIFAPTDEAFNQLSHGNTFDLLKNITALRKLLEYHIVPLKLTQADLIKMVTTPSQNASSSPSQQNQGQEQTVELPTISDHTLLVTFSNGLHIQRAAVLEPGLETDTSMVFPLEHVLWPPDLDAAAFSSGRSESSSEH
jgi:uncharacterized surface protein with fasciclin (FAS1) repeats